MIKKLRIKLILASMFSLFTVLFIIIGLAGIINYRNLISEADSTLTIISENDGGFPEPFKIMGQQAPDDFLFHNDHKMSPELPYESRYFYVSFDSSENVIAANTGKIAAVNTSEAIEYAQEVLASGSTSGFSGNYRYMVTTTDSETQIFFLDCGRNLSTFKNFMITCTLVSFAGLGAVLFLLIFLSRKIVKPFSENYEKQKRFITDAGHELKTPLTIIDADAEVLEMDFGENEWLSDIQSQTKRLTELTNSLILLARMEEEQPKMEMIEFPISDIAEESVAAFQALAKTQNKTLTGEIQPVLSMVGDEKSIRRLFTILLDNAVKYSDKEGRISLKLEKQKNQIRISVFNTAEAVSKESISHFFDRFYRADQSRNSRTGGYGLGLSIALAIVNAHKGKISASTEDEKSLLITVTFPV